jgi:hypothetical protein
MNSMLGNQGYRFAHQAAPSALRGVRLACAFLLAAAALALGACHRGALTDTRPLDNAGMSYDAIQQLKALEITDPEALGIAQARQAGLSDAGCVEMEKIFRGRSQQFDAGSAVAGLLQAGVSEDTVLALAKLGQLGLGTGELQAMRLAGLSDAIILEVARHRAGSQPVLSGASLAMMRNAEMRESTLLELVRRGVPDTEAGTILSFRRHGASDADILRDFKGPRPAAP